MSDPTFRVEPDAPPPVAGVSASGLRPAPSQPRFGGITAPRVAYAIGFVGSALLLWFRFNSTFGNKDYGPPMSPLRAFQDAKGGFLFLWDAPQRHIVFLLVLVLGYLVLTFCKAGRRRGMAALVLAFFTFVSINPSTQELSSMLLYVAAGGLCGAIFLRRELTTVWTRRAFWICLVLLAAVLWMPFPINQMETPGYESAGTELISAYLDPPREFNNEPIDSIWERYGVLMGVTLPQTVGMLLLVLGVLIALGRTWRWLRPAAIVLLVILVFGLSIGYAINGALQRPEKDLSNVLNAFYSLGVLWFTQFVLFTWPLAGAVQEATAAE